MITHENTGINYLASVKTNRGLEVHQRSKLCILVKELLIWRVFLDNLYRQEQLSKKRLSAIYS